MRVLRAVLFSLLLTLGVAAARPAAGPSDAIRQILNAQAAAWNRGDLAGFMHGYWRSPQTQFIGASGVTLGWTTVRDRYAQNYPSRAAMGRLSYSDLQVTVLCADAGYVVGHFRLDRAHDHPQGVFTLLLRRESEGWRIVSDHTTGFARGSE